MYQHIHARHPDSEEVKVKIEEKPEIETLSSRAVLKNPPPDHFSDSNLEMMKLRTERFGTTSSAAMREVLLSETKKRRRDRFGEDSSEELGSKKVVLDQKMLKRKERFGKKNNFIDNLVLCD